MILNSYFEGMSGGDTWAIEVAKRLKNEFNVDIKIITPERAKIEFKKRGLEDKDFIITTNESKPRNLALLYLSRILSIDKKELKTDKKDILFATSIFLPDILPLKYLKGRKITIYHMQAPNPIYGYKKMINRNKKNDLSIGKILNWLNEKISLFIFKKIGNEILVLPTTKETIENYGFSKNRIIMTKNGVDLDFINNIPKGEKEFEACWIGRPHPQKGLDDLIKIWSIVVKEKPNVKLILMGKNIEKYQEKINDINLEKNIILKGFVSEEEKFRIMKMSKMFLSTSYFESFHIAILEALACNLPVIAYDIPVYKQVYGNILIYVDLGDFINYKKKIIQLLENDLDKDDKSKLIEELLQEFSWDKIAKNFWLNLKKMYKSNKK